MLAVRKPKRLVARLDSIEAFHRWGHGALRKALQSALERWSAKPTGVDIRRIAHGTRCVIYVARQGNGIKAVEVDVPNKLATGMEPIDLAAHVADRVEREVCMEIARQLPCLDS